MPKVSVIMPSLNVAPYIKECIESVINQTLKDIEIICVDAGSTDGTLEILQEYVGKDSRIKLIISEKKSYGYQMNLGIEAAQGKYIGIVETDDFIVPYMFSELLDVIEKNEVDYVKCDFYDFLVRDMKIIKTYRRCLRSVEKSNNLNKYYNRILTNLDPEKDYQPYDIFSYPWNGLYRKSFLNSNDIRFNETPGASFQDNGFTFQLLCFGKRTFYLQKGLYFYRNDNPNSSFKSRDKAYVMKDEYDFIESILNKKLNRQKKYAYIYTRRKFGSYLFNLERITNEFKYDFLMLFANDYRKYENEGEILKKAFREDLWSELIEIVENPTKYYLRRFKLSKKSEGSNIDLNTIEDFKELKNEIERLNEKLKIAQQEVIFIHNSWSYRIGRFITYLPRKIRGFILCKKEHGWDYTIKRVFEHIGIGKKTYENIGSVQKKEKKIYKSSASDKYVEELRNWYKGKMGRELNLDNPRSFNEKIQWLKIYDSTPIKTRLADKYLVREWVAEKIGEEYLIPLIGVWDSFDEIDFDALPNQFVLKANHGSGWNIIVSDKSVFDKNNARSKFNKWLSKNYAFYNGFELHYSNIKPRIICEKYIQNTIGLIDYRFYCFNGEPKQVWVDIFSGTPNHKRDIFDISWKRIPVKCKWPSGEGLLDKKPELFEQMVEKAKILSQGFSFVRVDFFEVEKKLYFGEMTFTPMSGIGKFEPEEYDLMLGNMITLPQKYPIPKVKQEQKIKITVIIPVYNTDKYLKDSLDSILNQTMKNIEVICIDDGSSDDSYKILKEYEAQDRRITVLKQKHAGAGAARNKGLELARGEYLYFPDSDDFFELTLLEDACTLADSKNADIVIFKIRQFDEQTKEYKEAPWAFHSEHFSKEVFSCHDAPDRIFNSFQNWAWNKLFKRTFIEKNNIKFQEIQRTNDLLFTCSALATAERIALLNKTLVNYRIKTGSSSQDTNHAAPIDFYKAFCSLKDFLEQRGLYYELERSFVNWALEGCIYNLESLKDEKTYTSLYRMLRKYGFERLGITAHSAEYFYDKKRYQKYLKIKND